MAATDNNRPRPATDLIIVATVSKPHGLEGALKVWVETHNPDRFRPGRKLLAVVGGKPRTFTVTKFVPQNDWGILTLAEASNCEQAEALRGVDLGVPERELAALPNGSYYTFQIIGLTVRSLSGTDLGKITIVEELPAGDAYVVSDGTRQFRVPAKGDIIREIDLARGLMVIDDLEGLR
ncbi:MAG: ribosome maturation factor RimM [Candidatus Edwardsbacteria bacterium]|nr:ribosome maturation factor RimM [Candidatus Edwardsbacteria bacterium]